jgi:hypothetical protein
LQQPIQKWLGRIDSKPAEEASISAMDQAILREGFVMVAKVSLRRSSSQFTL